MAKRGPKTKYTPETISRLKSAIKLGAPYTHACNYAGITFETLSQWLKKFPELSEQLKEAEGEAVTGWLKKIEKSASDGNWQAAAWKLERRYPEEFGRREKVEHSNPDGTPLGQPIADALTKVYGSGAASSK